ncbi:uncharacterized protein LOC131929897 [Physella acuta]|uniref:uncharacterized protein LOC131929897 n=1 Tax=Physella acuta TaxID=109671 RepID=UPI0027DBBE88|nr:uncharacterized protein LOC131929897 [Physella acuta]
MMLLLLMVFLIFCLENGRTYEKNTSFEAVIVGFERDCIRHNCRHTGRFYGYFWHPFKILPPEAKHIPCIDLWVHYCYEPTDFDICTQPRFWDRICLVWSVCIDGKETCDNNEYYSCRCKRGKPYYFSILPRYFTWYKMVFTDNEEPIAESGIFNARDFPEDWDPLEKPDFLASTNVGCRVISEWIAVLNGVVLSFRLAKIML